MKASHLIVLAVLAAAAYWYFVLRKKQPIQKAVASQVVAAPKAAPTPPAKPSPVRPSPSKSSPAPKASASLKTQLTSMGRQTAQKAMNKALDLGSKKLSEALGGSLGGLF